MERGRLHDRIEDQIQSLTRRGQWTSPQICTTAFSERQTVVACGDQRVKRIVRRLRRWPLWGVLLTAIGGALLWERGEDLFHGFPLLIPLVAWVALPVIGGFVTPEKPAYTVAVFAVGSPLLSCEVGRARLDCYCWAPSGTL